MRLAVLLDFLLVVSHPQQAPPVRVPPQAPPVQAATAPAPRAKACCGCGPACGCEPGSCPDGCPDQIAYKGEPAKAGYHIERGADGVHWWWVKDGRTFAHNRNRPATTPACPDGNCPLQRKGVTQPKAVPFPAGYRTTQPTPVRSAGVSSGWSSGSYRMAPTFTGAPQATPGNTSPCPPGEA